MKIVSCIKQVYDLDIVLENDWVVDETQNSVDIHYANRIMNSYDEASLELMLQLKDNDVTIRTEAVTIGEKPTESILQKALAVGVDEATRIDVGSTHINNPFDNATLLYETIKEDDSIDLILCGKQSDITNYGQTGQILAEKLNWASFTNVFEIDFIDSYYRLSRLVKDGVEKVTIKGPLVVTSIPSPNKFLRMASLRDMMKAKKKDIKVISKELALEILSKKTRQYKSVGITIDKPVKDCIYLENTSDKSTEDQLNELIISVREIGDVR
jgi:electron transfer flavoprotein beta subunit